MDVPQRFCVRWNSYKSNLQTAFPKLLTSEHFVDVTLACEKQFIKCHKIVLSACSVYFETLLVNNPCQHPIIFMKDVEFWEIKALVEFMYKGEVNVSQNQLDSLLKSAESLQIRGLSGTKQFVHFEQSDGGKEDNLVDFKSKRNKSDNEEEEDNFKKRKKKNEEEDKYVHITSVKGQDGCRDVKLEENPVNIHDQIIKEETIEHEEYEYENSIVDVGEEEEEIEGYCQDEFYIDHNIDPGPSGVSELVAADDGLPLQEFIADEKEDLNVRPTRSNVKSVSDNDKLKKGSTRRSCYKQYSMANMWAALERIEQGLSVYRASLEYGVPRKTLRNWMKKYNIMSYFDLRKQEREKQDFVVNVE